MCLWWKKLRWQFTFHPMACVVSMNLYLIARPQVTVILDMTLWLYLAMHHQTRSVVLGIKGVLKYYCNINLMYQVNWKKKIQLYPLSISSIYQQYHVDLSSTLFAMKHIMYCTFFLCDLRRHYLVDISGQNRSLTPHTWLLVGFRVRIGSKYTTSPGHNRSLIPHACLPVGFLVRVGH